MRGIYMKLEKLKELYNTCRHLPKYQYKDLPENEFLERAYKSFDKLSEKQKKQVFVSWCKVLNKAELSTDEVHELWKFRFISQTNLYFLCHLLESYNETTVKTHEEICNDFFVQKDPTFVTFREFADQYTELKTRMLLVPRGGFKALALDTPIPTPKGMSSIADLKVGDVVFGDDGKKCNIIGKSEIFTGRDCYEIMFSTGEKIIADEQHLWITDSRLDRDRLKGKNGKTIGPKPSIKTTKEILDTLYCRKERNHRVHITKPLDLPEKNYTISPYVLGCWLGDGTSSNSNFTCNDSQIIEEIINEGEIIRKSSYKSPYLYVFNGGKGHTDYRRKSNKSLSSRLRYLGVLNNKHIPDEYLRGSYNQRLSLLQGLMDTDGTCDKRGHCSFSNTNKKLIEQVRELVASLGLKPFDICEFDSYCGEKYCGKAYQVGFIAYKGTNVFRLSRKLEKLSAEKKVSLSKYRQIVSVKKIESVPTQCISVDSYNHTYLVGRSFIPTHNSSLNMADCIQWVICFPAITILILTGVYDLAGDFVGEIKRHFTLEESGEPDGKGKMGFIPKKIRDKVTGEWTESLFQSLFPEHCIKPTDGTMFEYQTPAEADKKEPTVRAASIEQALSGSHFDILDLDDVVTNENSQTPDRMLKVNKQIEINKAMLNPYGFFTIIGTWYDELDFYGLSISQEEQFAKEQGIVEGIYGSVDSGKFNSSVYCKLYLRAAWWPTEDAKKLGKIEEEMTESDWELWFPERLTYKFLSTEKKTDKTGTTFAIKYLNDPRKMHKVKFPRELLVRQTVPHNQMPPVGNGIVVTAIDTAYSTKSWADYTVIMTALIFGGRFYIVNMVRGRFNEDELPKVIAQSAYKWKPRRIAIEESVGVRWFKKELGREMDNLQISVPVEYISLQQGSKLRSKQMKAKPVLRLLGDKRLYFMNSCEGLEEIYDEMSKFTGTADDKHDDIVSAISLLVEQYGGYADMDNRINSINQDYVLNRKSQDIYERTYLLGKYAKYNEVGLIDDNPSTAYQTNQTQGQSIVQDPYVDPLRDLMQ